MKIGDSVKLGKQLYLRKVGESGIIIDEAIPPFHWIVQFDNTSTCIVYESEIELIENEVKIKYPELYQRGYR